MIIHWASTVCFSIVPLYIFVYSSPISRAFAIPPSLLDKFPHNHFNQSMDASSQKKEREHNLTIYNTINSELTLIPSLRIYINTDFTL